MVYAKKLCFLLKFLEAVELKMTVLGALFFFFFFFLSIRRCLPRHLVCPASVGS